MKSTSFPAVVTAAGAATRFRPFSRAVPKEMLPVGTTPAVEHVIHECLAAGASEVIVVTRPGDTVVPGYVSLLQDEGLPVETVEEDLSHGYGNATPLLTLRERLVDCETFAVAFGDDLLLAEPTRGSNFAAMRERTPAAEVVVAGQLVDVSQVRSFGIIDTDPDMPESVVGIRQRPHPHTVEEPLAVVSRLVLRPSILDALLPSDAARGEVDLGIAVGRMAGEAPVRVHRVAGQWVTVGDPEHYLEALQRYQHLHATTSNTRGAS